MSQEQAAERPMTRFEVNGTAGLALNHALDAQREFATRLLKALIAKGALSADTAKALMVETADAIEGGMPKMPAREGKPLPYFVMVVERLRNHAKALRGFANTLR